MSLDEKKNFFEEKIWDNLLRNNSQNFNKLQFLVHKYSYLDYYWLKLLSDSTALAISLWTGVRPI